MAVSVAVKLLSIHGSALSEDVAQPPQGFMPRLSGTDMHSDKAWPGKRLT